jgi:hemerythrin-like domain-containing protein
MISTPFLKNYVNRCRNSSKKEALQPDMVQCPMVNSQQKDNLTSDHNFAAETLNMPKKRFSSLLNFKNFWQHAKVRLTLVKLAKTFQPTSI